jgi:cholesterol transport system auxiliary component
MTVVRALRLLVLAAPLLVGCGAAELLPKASERPDLFVLTPKSTFREDLPRVQAQLAVDLPIASAGLDSGRIALMHDPVKVDYYARSNWIDRAPAMVQTLLIESFENSERIVGVGRLSVNLRADYVLVTELREFQVEYFRNKGPQAHVRMNAKIVAMPERIIIGNVSSERIVEAEKDTMTDIIPAFDEALGGVLKDIVEWSIDTIAAAPGA